MWNLHLYPGNTTRMTLRFYLVLFKGRIIIKGSISATRTLHRHVMTRYFNLFRVYNYMQCPVWDLTNLFKLTSE